MWLYQGEREREMEEGKDGGREEREVGERKRVRVGK